MHFYERTESGVIEPRHFSTTKTGKNAGKSRPSRVTDARAAAKEGRQWMPSVTAITGMLDKAALMTWKVKENLKTVWEMLTDKTLMDAFRKSHRDAFMDKVMAVTEERLEMAPKAGTDIHKVLENYLRDGEIPDDPIEQKICANVNEALDKLAEGTFPEWEFEKYVLSDKEGYAGCMDVVGTAGYNHWVIDFKSKQLASKFKPGKMAYAEHAMQLAAYGRAEFCQENPVNFRAANIFICLENGEIDVHEHSQKDLLDGWLDFKACLGIYHRRKYNPFGERLL